jgi:competence protein ComEC
MPYYKITFIDVGQGDSTLIQTHHGKCNILIDSYNNLDYLESLGTNHIDYIFISHFDKDHVSTLNDIIDDYKVKMIYYSEKSVTEEYIKNDNWINLNAGDELNIEGVRISVLGPLKDYNSLNLNSLVLKIYINSNTFLFTGDINEEVEFELIDIYGSQLKSDVLKVAHHGSESSSTIDFVNAVSPKICLIGVGKDNKYGHPNGEVIKRLKQLGIKIYRTDECGEIFLQINKKGKIVNNIHR